VNVERLKSLRFSTTQVADLLGICKYTFRKRIERIEGYRGKLHGRKHWYTWEEILWWEHELKNDPINHDLNPSKNK
jgi:hypothetical protein